jgi:putative endonuclease
MHTTAVGRLGEIVAAAYLTMRGLRVLERGFRATRSEIDIIAADGPTLVFIEVKLRGERAKAPGREAVGARKRQRIVRGARAYLARHELTSRRTRFDVIEVHVTPRGLTLTHLPDAFRPDRHEGRWGSCWRPS